MTKGLAISPLTKGRGRKFLTVALTIVLVFGLLPLTRTQAMVAAPISKLSGALQQALNANVSTLWSDPSRQRLRVLIQSNGPFTASLNTAITQSGGVIVRQFDSINGVLADLPKNRVLTLAARSDVDRTSADHLAQM